MFVDRVPVVGIAVLHDFGQQLIDGRGNHVGVTPAGSEFQHLHDQIALAAVLADFQLVECSVDAGLYDAILNRCVDPRRMCAHEMMAIDAAGGRPARQSGLTSLAPRARGDIRGRPFVPAAVCNVDEVPKPAFTLALSAP